jgi:hypothetical protein
MMKDVFEVGRRDMGKWGKDDYISCLRRAFVRSAAREVSLDDGMWRSTFLCACIAWGLESGILRRTRTHVRKGTTIFFFELTTHGERRVKGDVEQKEVACAE